MKTAFGPIYLGSILLMIGKDLKYRLNASALLGREGAEIPGLDWASLNAEKIETLVDSGQDKLQSRDSMRSIEGATSTFPKAQEMLEPTDICK